MALGSLFALSPLLQRGVSQNPMLRSSIGRSPARPQHHLTASGQHIPRAGRTAHFARHGARGERRATSVGSTGSATKEARSGLWNQLSMSAMRARWTHAPNSRSQVQVWLQREPFSVKLADRDSPLGVPLLRLALLGRAGQTFDINVYWSCMTPSRLCHGFILSALSRARNGALIAGATVLVSACLPSLAGRLFPARPRELCIAVD